MYDRLFTIFSMHEIFWEVPQSATSSELINDLSVCIQTASKLASHADVLGGWSRVPASKLEPTSFSFTSWILPLLQSVLPALIRSPRI